MRQHELRVSGSAGDVRSFTCPVERTLAVIGGKWKPAILWELRPGRRRFSELLAAVPGVTHQVLTRQLRQLQRDGIISRTVQTGGERHVEYSFTDFGRSLHPSRDAMADWAKRHANTIDRVDGT
jgi:DNA-binding HxlR family transcriptional regulator